MMRIIFLNLTNNYHHPFYCTNYEMKRKKIFCPQYQRLFKNPKQKAESVNASDGHDKTKDIYIPYKTKFLKTFHFIAFNLIGYNCFVFIYF
ncbi:hypothetical protein BLOT_000244 [Blomia tropicalis]|nr:hypothetical protein BLOT_000244 [Blomia tropicalis]